MIDELNIPEEFQDEFLSWDIEIHENNGNSGEDLYGYFFYVPEEASEDILSAMNWTRGACIELSLNAFDEPDMEMEL